MDAAARSFETSGKSYQSHIPQNDDLQTFYCFFEKKEVIQMFASSSWC
jgi:hypothetical protein